MGSDGVQAKFWAPVFLFQMRFLVHFFQSVFEHWEFFQLGIKRKNGLGFEASLLDHFHVPQIFHRPFGDAGLAFADEFARTADLEILFGQLEAVFGFNEGFQPFFGRFRSRIGEKKTI